MITQTLTCAPCQQTALVLIDLQQGILPFAQGPYLAEQILPNAKLLMDHFHQHHAPVVLVRVDWSKEGKDALTPRVDQPLPPRQTDANWSSWPAQLPIAEQDIVITKRQWGAFYGTELDLQLRRRGISQIVLAGISTNIGVESTARQAWEHGYSLLIAEDCCGAASSEQHQHSMQYIFPRIAQIRDTATIIAALS